MTPRKSPLAFMAPDWEMKNSSNFLESTFLAKLIYGLVSDSAIYTIIKSQVLGVFLSRSSSGLIASYSSASVIVYSSSLEQHIRSGLSCFITGVI